MRRFGRGARLEEIEAVYRRRLPELRRVATAITGSREGGQDAVQDAFASAVHRREQFRGRGSVDAWLWRIVVHAARDSARRTSSTRAHEADGSAAGPAPGNAADSRDAGVRALVRELPERQRLALFLHYYADLDYATIADALEISSGTVGATLNQARESLRRRLTEVTV